MKQSEALSRAAALCSRTEYCERQIREKLQKWEVEPSECDTIINRLYEEKFLDINRYCHAFCSDKFRQNHWGRLKIKQALVMQGLPSPDIQEALADLDSQEYRNALRHILMQKNKTIKDTDPYTRKVKLARHALSKGFENHLIIPLIEEEF